MTSNTEAKIREILAKSPYGLTIEEISERAGVNKITTEKILSKIKTRKTKAGTTAFYALTVLLLMVAASHALEMNSTNYEVSADVIAAGGGVTDTNTFILFSKIGQTASGTSRAPSFSVCSGFMCSFLEFVASGKITFLLELNISGNENDVGFVDNFTAFNRYSPNDIVNYYACIHDTSVASSPTFGVIFAGSSLNYINLSSGNSFVLRVSQDIPGNKIILPVTSGNCTILNTRMSQITQFGTILQPFVLTNNVVNAVELALSYPSINIAGDFQKTGAFTLIMEKNATDENQIIVRPV